MNDRENITKREQNTERDSFHIHTDYELFILYVSS